MTKHTAMKFMWRAGKPSRRQHIQGPDGRTLCRLENGGAKTDVISDEPDPHRRTCAICLSLHASGKREREFSQKGRKKILTPERKRRRRGRYCQGQPAGEHAWETSPLGQRFAHLVDDPHD
jgi:hypothetical protein